MKTVNKLNTYNSDALICEDSGRNELWQFATDRFTLRNARNIGDQVVDNDQQASQLDDVGKSRTHSQVFETLDEIEQNHSRKKEEQKPTDVVVCPAAHVGVDSECQKILGNEKSVGTAETELSDEQTDHQNLL